VIPRILSHYASKSVNGPDLCACLRKKSQENGISPIFPEGTHEWIFTKFGLWRLLMDVINCDKFWDDLLKGLNFTGVKSPIFPIGN